MSVALVNKIGISFCTISKCMRIYIKTFWKCNHVGSDSSSCFRLYHNWTFLLTTNATLRPYHTDFCRRVTGECLLWSADIHVRCFIDEIVGLPACFLEMYLLPVPLFYFLCVFLCVLQNNTMPHEFLYLFSRQVIVACHSRRVGVKEKREYREPCMRRVIRFVNVTRSVWSYHEKEVIV